MKFNLESFTISCYRMNKELWSIIASKFNANSEKAYSEEELSF